jgi:hypothetical protein
MVVTERHAGNRAAAGVMAGGASTRLNRVTLVPEQFE